MQSSEAISLSNDQSINLNSLRMVRSELDASLVASNNEFEAYLADPQNTEHLLECARQISCIGGTLRLIEVDGGALLADEITEVLNALVAGTLRQSDHASSTLTRALFILPRFIEYVAAKRIHFPILVLLYVNELKALRSQAFIPESTFAGVEFSLNMPELQGNTSVDLQSDLKRYQPMYQVGLLKLIKDQQTDASMNLMLRAVQRVKGAYGSDFWLAAELVIENIIHGNLVDIDLTRKRNLAAIEKIIRRLINKGPESLTDEIVTPVYTELVFLLMLCREQDAESAAFCEQLSLPMAAFSDRIIAEERHFMHGPSADTIESVVKVICEELRSAKDILELASQNQLIEPDELVSLIDILTRMADTLVILNLKAPCNVLRERLVDISSWQGKDKKIQPEDFLEVANALLFVESTLAGLIRRTLTASSLEEVTEQEKEEIIASNHIVEAQKLVIKEAQAGVALAKRAITSYVESNFETAHIFNVATSLDSVRGGLSMMALTRGANVLTATVDFINHYINEGKKQEQPEQLLEILADTLISLEYYLSDLEISGLGDEKILEVAEDSLKALGFVVNDGKQ